LIVYRGGKHAGWRRRCYTGLEIGVVHNAGRLNEIDATVAG
jgi:hypothetical protein